MSAEHLQVTRYDLKAACGTYRAATEDVFVPSCHTDLRSCSTEALEPASFLLAAQFRGPVVSLKQFYEKKKTERKKESPVSFRFEAEI